jgi:hypothetical protein
MTQAARRLLVALSVGAAVAVALLHVSTAAVRAQDAVRGAALMALAQEAIGGAMGLASVKTLHVTGTFRRVIGDSDTDGDFEVFLELPDKYLRSEKTGTPGQPSTETIEALAGAEVRDEVRGGGGSGSGRGAPDGGDLPFEEGGPVEAGEPEAGRDSGTGGAPGDFNAGAMQGGTRAPAGGAAVDPNVQRRARQADVSRLLLMWLLRSETPLTWVGIAQSPDGTADVVEARYADGQPTRLFLESQTHMPLMLQWIAAPGGAGPAGRRGRGGRRGAAPEGAAEPQGGPPQPATLNMTFSEHRAVGGIRLPYVITRGIDGQTTERWNISRYRVNPSLDAETFSR